MNKEENVLFQNKYYKRSMRFRGWNYASGGYYFVTVCTKNFQSFFGRIHDKRMQLSEIGRMADKYWKEITKHYPNTELDEFIIMPNHVYGIIRIKPVDKQNIRGVETCHGKSLRRDMSSQEYRAKYGKLQKGSLSSIVNQFKGAVTRYARQNDIYFHWQPKFYDRIIRNKLELDKIRQYIVDNPIKWEYEKALSLRGAKATW